MFIFETAVAARGDWRNKMASFVSLHPHLRFPPLIPIRISEKLVRERKLRARSIELNPETAVALWNNRIHNTPAELQVYL